MDEKWNRLNETLRDLPLTNPNDLDNAATLIGERLGQRASQLGVNREGPITTFRGGYERGFSGSSGGTGTGDPSHR